MELSGLGIRAYGLEASCFELRNFELGVQDSALKFRVRGIPNFLNRKTRSHVVHTHIQVTGGSEHVSSFGCSDLVGSAFWRYAGEAFEKHLCLHREN